MKLLHKIKGRSGFTLAETLLAVLILLLVSGIVASGIPVAKNVYDKTIVAANAQVLLSTTVTALKDELGTAWDVNVEEYEGKKAITYFSADTGAKSRIYIKDNAIWIQDYAEVDGLIKTDDTGAGKARKFISGKAVTDNLFVVFDSDKDTLSETTVSISNIKVYRDNPDNALAELDTLVIRPVSVYKKSA